jgi:hypothetical protein
MRRGAVRAGLSRIARRIVEEKTKELIAASLSYPDVKSEWKNPIVLDSCRLFPADEATETLHVALMSGA